MQDYRLPLGGYNSPDEDARNSPQANNQPVTSPPKAEVKGQDSLFIDSDTDPFGDSHELFRNSPSQSKQPTGASIFDSDDDAGTSLPKKAGMSLPKKAGTSLPKKLVCGSVKTNRSKSKAASTALFGSDDDDLFSVPKQGPKRRDHHTVLAMKARDGQNAVMIAVRAGHEAVVRRLLDAGAPIDDQDRKGFTALMHAASLGKHTIIRSLLARGAEITLQDNQGRTALMHAAVCGHMESVQAVLS
jgi:hypothetical protein